LAGQLEQQLTVVSDEMSKLNADRAAVARAASAAAPVAGRFAERLAELGCDSAFALRTMQSISQEAESIAQADERAAEQATMALDSLYIAYQKQGKPANDSEVRSAINGLFQQLENPSAYNADQFAAALRRLHGLLR
jgi:uncharacterized protein YicC (UPF0701 family)